MASSDIQEHITESGQRIGNILLADVQQWRRARLELIEWGAVVVRLIRYADGRLRALGYGPLPEELARVNRKQATEEP